MLKPTFLAALVITATLAAPLAARAETSTAETVIATVNDKPITLGQMIVMRQSMQDEQIAGVDDAALWDLLLDQLIRQTAIAEIGKESAATRAQLALQRRSIMAASAISELTAPEPTEAEVQAAYDEVFATEDAITEYSAAHILVKTEEIAKKLKAELDEGADFGKLAEENSTGPSGPNKGDLGWFTLDQMVPSFGEALKDLEKGQVSDPVQTDFGWHLILLKDTRVKEAPKLSEIRDQITQLVRRQKVEAAIQEAMENAKIVKTDNIDPELMGEVDLLKAE